MTSKYPRAHTQSTLRHESCKFGIWIDCGTAPSVRGCENDHCKRTLSPGQCLVCGWYSVKVLPKLICPYCKKEMVKHIIKEGARYHVTSYHGSKNGALSHCSEPDCENNHGPGHCVPLKETPIPGWLVAK